MLCDLVARKNNKLGIIQFYKKGSQNRAIMYEDFLTSKPNYQYYGHNHDIVCSNDHILCKCVRLGMEKNVFEGSFHFLCTKNSFFNFLSATNRCFCQRATKIQFDNWTKTISKNSRPLRVSNSPLGGTINHL
jgi:hypothetical protein